MSTRFFTRYKCGLSICVTRLQHQQHRDKMSYDLTVTCSHGSNCVNAALQTDDDNENNVEKGLEDEVEFTKPFLFSDVVLLVEGRPLHCHRAMLSIYSPVFKAMFQNGFLENERREVVIKSQSYDDVLELLKHMYTPGGRDMSTDSAQRLLPLTHHYQIDSMVDQAEKMLTFRLTAMVAPSCLRLADLYGLLRLRQAALEACSRLESSKFSQVADEVKLSQELRKEVLERRVGLLESFLNDIERSFTHSCVRMESRMERVPSNHCSKHAAPLTNIQIERARYPAELGNEVDIVNDLGQPERRNVLTSIRPSQQVLNTIEERPVAQAIIDNRNRIEAEPEAPETITAVCDQCVVQFKEHIVQLCRRGLNKIPIVQCKQTPA